MLGVKGEKVSYTALQHIHPRLDVKRCKFKVSLKQV